MKPLVSLIVPIYNVEAYLERCLHSLINQDYINIEIILVDDGSPDKCGQICDRFQKLDNRIIVIHKSNGGLSDARNHGIEIARGDYFMFVDSDDFLHESCVSKLIDIAVLQQCELVQCDYLVGSDNEFGRIQKNIKIKYYNRINVFYKRDLKVTAWAKLYKKELFQQERFPVGKINEDEFVTYKISFMATKIAILNEKLYYYFQSPNSIMRDKNRKIKLDFLEAYEERIAYFKIAKEDELVLISQKELAIRAMIYYIKSSKEDSQYDDLFLKVCKENTKLAIHSKKVSLYEKMILRTFCLVPSIIKKVIKN